MKAARSLLKRPGGPTVGGKSGNTELEWQGLGLFRFDQISDMGMDLKFLVGNVVDQGLFLIE